VPPRRRGILIPALVTLFAFGVLMALGLWQLQRLQWKEGLIATLERRLAAPPVPVPPRAQWPALSAAADEFRRVSVQVRFAGAEARVYSSGGGLRNDIQGPGYFAFAPAISDAGALVVNRGFVSNANPDASLRPIAVPAGTVEIVGVLRWPEKASWFVTPYSEREDLWMVRDHIAMWAHYGWGNDADYGGKDTAPFYIEQESPLPPGGVPRPGRLTVKLRNDHFGYALTWFGLAAVLMITFGFWIRARRRLS